MEEGVTQVIGTEVGTCSSQSGEQLVGVYQMSVGDEVVNFLNSSPMSLNSMLHVWPRKLLCMLPGLPFIKTSMEMDCSGVVESMVCTSA